ncbi:MAG: YggS family pyridoxal phosphate-dependent enzyme [Bacilli bacterium]|nr:YggS family pyridoxal phosphate-dependent enzyme [Bacilli bacterium]
MLRSDIDLFLKTIPKNVTLVAATKYISAKEMEELLEHHIYDFGENRVDSFLEKYEHFKDISLIKWHFIGHLQRNKAKRVINKIDYLHSLDSLELAKIIDKERKTPLKTFIEVSINLEESKNGVPYYEVDSFLKELLNYHNIQVVGLMMMAVKGSLNTEEQFKKLRILRDELEKKFNIKIPYLSMGMSDDYISAINNGATHIRLGRILYKI